MQKILFIIIIWILATQMVQAQYYFKSDTSLADVKWFPDAKFGVFIHYTLKNVPDIPNDEGLGRIEKAKQVAMRMDASKYDPKKWAKEFKSWGAKYAVLTTKHHIGFGLFDGPGQFNVMNSSPVKRDLVREFADAMRAEGIKVGFYFSLPDWSHPDYASLANVRVKPEERIANHAYAVQDDTVRWNRFLKQMFAEVRHLCTHYGKVDLLWFDGDWERTAEQWKTMDLAKMIYELQPGCVINNRLRHIDLGHYATPENVAPLAPRNGWWEFCMTPGDNWDGKESDMNLKPPSELVRIFGDMISMGGNVLINVAPTDHGDISKEQRMVMNKTGKWIASHGDAIYASRKGLPPGLFNGGSIRKGKDLYLIVYDTPRDEIVLKGTNNGIRKITHLLTGKELEWRYSGGFINWNQKGWLYIKIPQQLMDTYASVIKIEFEDEQVVFQTPSGEKFEF